MTARLSTCKEALDESLSDESKPWTPLLSYLEEKTGVKRFYLFMAIVILTGIYLVIGYAAQLLCNIIGFLYPAYASMKALETRETGDDTKWLTYWTVFALFSIIEYPSDLLLYWFPFYWLLKCIFMVWLFLPLDFNGSIFLYNNIIRPKFLKHRSDVDRIFTKVADTG
ncbi:hypothetical protein AAG570_008022 [Ranatra chinensis]|uniref:Receptor expression-enhancing protein n=1 Tax=Ranatra chinensis TaxID=642074 RepID=A0ABD0YC49_9HEMI